MPETRLKVEGIVKRFGAIDASRDITLELVDNEIHALIGPNGAGKSTLIQQIAGGLKPDAGNVFIDGEDVTAMNTAQRARRGLGRTFQVSSLALADTVLQNTLLSVVGAKGSPWRFFRSVERDAYLIDRAHDALQRVGLAEKAQTRTANLSHGQRRLLEIAVALTLTPKAFVMDEPMAGLGASGTERMTRFLDTLRHEAPILLVEHDMDAVFALADRISVLVYGKIIASGTVDEIRSNDAVQKAYLGETS